MKATIKYFGWIAEKKGKSSEEMDHNFINLDELVQFIHSSNPSLSSTNYRVSVNLNLTPSELLLQEGDEIAFLPPFSGG